MRRDTEYPRYLVDLKLARFKELRLLRGYGYGRVFHTLLKHRDLACVGRAAELTLPRFAHPLRILYRARMLKYARRSRSVGEKL